MRAGYRLAVLTVAVVLAGPAPAFARPEPVARPVSRLRLLASRTRALGIGVVKGGPIKTWHSIRDRPRIFAGAVAFTGLLGVGAQYFGFDPNPFVLGVAGGALVTQLAQSVRGLRRLRGEERWRKIGAEVIWPVLLVGSGAFLGVAAGEHVPAPDLDPHSPASLGYTFLRSVVMGGDEPAIFMMALPPPKPKKPRAKAKPKKEKALVREDPAQTQSQ